MKLSETFTNKTTAMIKEINENEFIDYHDGGRFGFFIGLVVASVFWVVVIVLGLLILFR
jgi:hypothetical protein